MKQFTKRGFAVTAGHGLVLGLMLVSTELSRLFMRDQKIQPIDFTVAIPDMGQSKQQDTQEIKSIPTPEPPEPEVEKTPEVKQEIKPKDEVKIEPKKDAPVTTVVENKPKWTPAPVDKIKIGPPVKNKNKVNLPPPTVDKSPLSLKQIQDALRDGATISDRNSIPEGDARFKAMIQNACYRAWDEPSTSLAAGKTLETELVFSLSGDLQSYRILRSSGLPELDQSVLAALGDIGRVSGIPSEFFEYYNRRIQVTFEVKE